MANKGRVAAHNLQLPYTLFNLLNQCRQKNYKRPYLHTKTLLVETLRKYREVKVQCADSFQT